MSKKRAEIPQNQCAACGCCVKVCPRQAVSIYKGIHAVVNPELCIGCGLCAKECPAGIITVCTVQEAAV